MSHQAEWPTLSTHWLAATNNETKIAHQHAESYAYVYLFFGILINPIYYIFYRKVSGMEYSANRLYGSWWYNTDVSLMGDKRHLLYTCIYKPILFVYETIFVYIFLKITCL